MNVVSEPGGWGVMAHQILADQLALSQPERHIMPNSLLLAPTDFWTFLRPWSECGGHGQWRGKAPSSKGFRDLDLGLAESIL